jgi:hypothetical protein
MLCAGARAKTHLAQRAAEGAVPGHQRPQQRGLGAPAALGGDGDTHHALQLRQQCVLAPPPPAHAARVRSLRVECNVWSPPLKANHTPRHSRQRWPGVCAHYMGR